MILETERLYFREISMADRPYICNILQDRQTMYAYEHSFTDEEVDNWIYKILNSYKNNGYGLWAVILKSINEFIGQAGLSAQTCENMDILEVGYLLNRAFWRNGFAFEAANSIKAYAFDTINANKVYSKIKFNNFPSQRVADKLGMLRIKSFNIHYYGKDMLHYLYAMPYPH